MSAKRKPQELIADPPTDALGPAMLACTEMQRRFVIGWIAACGKNASAVARAAGYSDKGINSRVRGHFLTRDPKILRALQEEAGRQLNGLSAIAVARLHLNLNSRNPKVAQVAIDSILDRTGFPRRTERSLDVTDHRPPKDFEQVLTMVSEKLRVLASKAQEPKQIEAQYTEVVDVAHADAVVGIPDERQRDGTPPETSNTVADKGRIQRSR